MRRTQIQLPDELYLRLKKLAARKEWSLSEVLRRGAEYVLLTYPMETQDEKRGWVPPSPRSLGKFRVSAKEWREIANYRE